MKYPLSPVKAAATNAVIAYCELCAETVDRAPLQSWGLVHIKKKAEFHIKMLELANSVGIKEQQILEWSKPK